MKQGIWRGIKKYIIVWMGNLCLLPAVIVASMVARFVSKSYDVGIGPFPMINNIYFKKALVLAGYTVETIADDCYYITEEFDFIYDKKHHLFLYFFPTLAFIRSVFRYKCVYIYFNGFVLHRLPVLRRMEPLLLKLAKIKVVVMPYGMDHQSFKRAKNILMQHFVCKDYPRFYKFSQEKVEKDIWRWVKGADYVLAHQECVDYIPYWDEVRWSLFGLDTDAIKPIYYSEKEKIRIFHAPNHRGMKGSEAIENAVKQLIDEGYSVEYVYLHGVSNAEIIKTIQQCDIIVDQLILGTYSMFSMEAMACGKAVVCYIRPDLKTFYEAVGGVIDVDELPLINATVFSIKDTLKELITNQYKIAEYGKRSRLYVEKYHSLSALGCFYKSVNIKLGISPSKGRV